jgi:lipopolysaccharide export system permease protein
MHKIAIPITCIIIVLFGAPLATSNQRGGASYGIGISLAATVLFILMINLTKAIGGRGVIEPEVAAWLPSMIFGLFGLFMLGRVRT